MSRLKALLRLMFPAPEPVTHCILCGEAIDQSDHSDCSFDPNWVINGGGL